MLQLSRKVFSGDPGQLKSTCREEDPLNRTLNVCINVYTLLNMSYCLQESE